MRASLPCRAVPVSMVLAGPALAQAPRAPASETSQRRLCAVIPCVLAGLSDVTSAMRPGITGVPDGWALPYWNMEKR